MKPTNKYGEEIKLYVFLDEDEKIITQVRAVNHDDAVRNANDKRVTYSTDFYATDAA